MPLVVPPGLMVAAGRQDASSTEDVVALALTVRYPAAIRFNIAGASA